MGDPLPDTERFQVREQLGKGGMGVVYRAFDAELGIEVALKTLLRKSPASLLRFKTEFRALADVSHRNLVTLYELVAEGEQWFFTMELLSGTDLLSYVCRDRSAPMVDVTRSNTEELTSPPTLLDRPTARDGLAERRAREALEARSRWELPDLDRLRRALRQLASGVHALHESGHLHRDIKPSNVLVTTDGRVVLLDFGVITELAGRQWDGPRLLVGTPAYMAPEQARGEAGVAADWYSVGVMLYEALTGQLPFRGDTEAVLNAKQLAEPPPPSLRQPEIPEDLDRLCSDLLRQDPRARPTGPEVLRRLGGRAESVMQRVRSQIADDAPLLVGRSQHLARLDEIFGAASRGEGRTVLVRGPSGMGKTALVKRFLDDVRARDQAVVLAGRCYERESLPFKAVDSVIDALCAFLDSLPPGKVEALMPREVQLLAKMFPVLRRFELGSTRAGTASPEPQEIRRRAFLALRELFGRLAARHPLVLFIDDAQWGDADSAALIEALMRPPDAPALLLLLSSRDDETDRGSFLPALRAHASPVELAVEALSDLEARELASALLGRSGDSTTAAEIARESHGHPYFVHELVRFAREGGGERAVSLDAVIARRGARLPDTTRRMLEVIAVASKPLPQLVAQRAAGLEAAERQAVVQQLRASQLARSSGARDDDPIECYHDRIRETIAGQLEEADLVRVHQRLARAHEAAPHPDPETLLRHCRACGELERASEYAVKAARRAEEALSFERAAELYRTALELRPGRDDVCELTIRLAEVLENAGRGGEAAPAFLSAAALSSGALALDLRRRAAEQYLRSGYLEQGLAVFAAVASEVGIRYPKTPLRGILGLLFRRGQLRLRGLAFEERKPGTITAAELMPIDVCWSAATGLSQIDTARAGVFSTRNVLLSLRAGDPYRVARSLMLESCFVAAMGTKSLRRTETLARATVELAERVRNERVDGLVAGMRGFTAFEQGRFREAHELCEHSIRMFAEQGPTFWELGSMHLFSLLALLLTGDFNTLRRLTPERLGAARARGDLYTTTNIRAIITPALMMADEDADAAEREATEALEDWDQPEGFHQQHFLATLMKSQVDLYRGNGTRAYERCLENEPALKRALLHFVQVQRGWWMINRSLSALAAAREHERPAAARGLIRRAARDARRLEGESAAWCDAHAQLIRAGVAHLRGDAETTVARLQSAVERFGEHGMMMHRASSLRGLGLRLGGDEGAAKIAEADEWFGSQRLRNPERVAAAMASVVAD